jgi:hypothetical protein
MMTFREYHKTQLDILPGNIVNEEVPAWANVGWEVFKFLEPTGLASIPDLITAFKDWSGDKNSPLKIAFLILSVLAVLPAAKYFGKSASKSLRLAINSLAKGGKADDAAKAVAKANEEIGKVAAELAEKFDPAKFKAAIENVPMIPQNVKQSMYSNADDLFKRINNFAKTPSMLTTQELGKAVVSGPLQAYKTMGNTTKGSMYTARGIKAGAEGTRAATDAINAQLKNQPGGGGDPYAPQTEPGEEVVTYTDPRTGKQIQTTRQALQDAGIAPLEQPQQPVYTFAGRALTPAQAAALGQFATPRIPGQPGQRGAPGTLMPQNVPQGATQENPFGRQNMAPQQFMKPDNFNNPPNFFSRPQTYNPYNQNQYGNQYGNPNDNQYGGNVFGGITSQMAGTPAAGMANLASGLIGVLPGLAGGGGANIGMNLLGMLPGLMGGI